MSTSNSNIIVDSSLILNVDASNPKSYSGSGTVWKDLSPNKKDGTLINGVVYNSSDPKSMVFDGVNDYVQLASNGESAFFPLPQFTIEVWYKSSGMGSGMLRGGLVCITYGLRIYILSSTQIQTSLTDTVSTLINQITTTSITTQNNTWKCITWSNDGINSKIYVNGILNISGAHPWQGTSGTTVGAVIGDDLNDVNRKLLGNIASTRIYNRVLTDQEILQNYNSAKSKFGI